ncbi:hypothetical protein [Paenibacillus sp. YIM B09110]|uniref:hypothetical protein n=1 Tax=Paenibacillus sp. YIM B09110 TaxID=3126102 RepID=UPI00301C3F68
MRYVDAILKAIVYIAVCASVGVGLIVTYAVIVSIPLWAQLLAAAAFIAVVIGSLPKERADDKGIR